MHTKSDTMDISLEMNVSTKYSSHIQTYMYDFKQSTRTDRGETIIKSPQYQTWFKFQSA